MTLETILKEAIKSAQDRQRLPEPMVRRMIRERAGISQADLARALGVERTTVGRWESGTRSPGRMLLGSYLQVLDRLIEELEQ